jgi:asparagine synthase (glutamine-hydrolysing)
MCGISGIVALKGSPVERLQERLAVMNELVAHRGPDGEGIWTNASRSAGLAHRRLSIIDLSRAGAQPMLANNGTVISHNGEVYNYIELHEALAGHWTFRSRTDTEAVLAAYDRHGVECLQHLRGMFAFAIWDEREQQLFLARDRFGIKPLYYAVIDDTLYFASEAKALLPFLPEVDTDPSALAEYLTFQFTIGEETLFKGIKQLLPGHALAVRNGKMNVWRYWDVHYEIDYEHTEAYFNRQLIDLVDESLSLHLRSDVPVGAYISGGIDSSLMALLAARADSANHLGFHGRFTDYPGYDESHYAHMVTDRTGGELNVVDITAEDFRRYIRDVVYHLDFPVAGPGSFPQFMVSKLAAERVKVVFGGQGGDEVFGGYARYLLAYFEQCIKAAVDGTYQSGNFVVTIESSVPNLGLLREYKPLMRQFWSEGLFRSLDERYFRLINRSADMAEEIEWQALDQRKVVEDFDSIFNNSSNVRKEAYFDSMTHFDFKCLLPALLHVEDRMSMAHGLESRVPLLDHPLVEFAATVPADIKFKDGHMKRLLKEAYADVLPEALLERRDKMGFPVPLKEWFESELRDLAEETFRSMDAQHRPFLNTRAVMQNFDKASQFSRKTWGLLNLELWHQAFHDRASEWRAMAA